MDCLDVLPNVCVYKLLQSQLFVRFDGASRLLAQGFPVSGLQRRAGKGLRRAEVQQ